MFRTTTSPKAPAAPHFPTYLLPSLKMPFLRVRQSSTTTTSSAVSNDVPSLSSSPTSATSTDDFFSSPPDVEIHTYSIPTDKPASEPPSREPAKQQPPPARDPTRDRLARTLPDVLRCNTCGTDVAYGLQVVSKGFTGRHGRALLVSAPLSSSQPSCPASPQPPTPATSSSTGGSGGGSSSNTPNILSPGHHAVARDGANLVNITVGRPEARNLVTGAHVVADINCATCGVKIGWKYVDAREQAQKYKVGKFILETERVVLLRSWEDVPAGEQEEPHQHFYSSSAPVGTFGGRRKSSSSSPSSARVGRKVSCSSERAGGVDGYVVEEGEDEEDEEESSGGDSEEEIVFDSEDEDECEDIFAGVWDAATVAMRRGSKVSGRSRYDARKGRGSSDGSR